MDPEGIGRTTADLLFVAINGEPVHDQRAGPCRLVPRDSIAAPVLRSDSRRHASPGASRGGRQGVTIGAERTPGQDLGFGFRQLADIAERALFPASTTSPPPYARCRKHTTS
ncbi:DUF2254 family protein [Micromonospora sp. NPDC048905]|uniref:DUF2254 family protein n=1 Tax=Micromonospora sp. NPDC048905 TaxID=3155494 RepID=UPI003403A5B1